MKQVSKYKEFRQQNRVEMPMTCLTFYITLLYIYIYIYHADNLPHLFKFELFADFILCFSVHA